MIEHKLQKPILQVLSGKPITPQPIWLMRQAGRYLPEYRELRSQAGDFLSLCFNPALASEVTLQPIRRFDFDAAILFSDILVIPHALGQKVWFAEGEGPKLTPLALADLVKLKPGNIRTALAPVFETVSTVKAKLPKSTALIGFAGAPWTVANYMIAGGSSDDSIHLRRFAYENTDALDRLFEILVQSTTDYLIAQIEAGAEVLQIFESWAGTIPAGQVKKYSLDPITKIISGVRHHSPAIPVIVFPRAAGTHYTLYAKQTGATAISVDTQTSLQTLRAELGPQAILQGNLDPIALISGGKHLQSAVDTIVDQSKDTPHIFNLGHGIRPETPIEHVEQLMRLVRKKI